MPENKSQPEEEEEERPKRYRITRKRLGTIRFVDPMGEYGFIEAEDFRDDVFFHHSVWKAQSVPPAGPLSPTTGNRSGGQSQHRADQHTSESRKKLVPEELVTKHVEFELDDEVFESEQKLRAKIVRPTRRPMGRKLSGRDATFKIVTHHPKARRKRPDWRG